MNRIVLLTLALLIGSVIYTTATAGEVTVVAGCSGHAGCSAPAAASCSAEAHEVHAHRQVGVFFWRLLGFERRQDRRAARQERRMERHAAHASCSGHVAAVGCGG